MKEKIPIGQIISFYLQAMLCFYQKKEEEEGSVILHYKETGYDCYDFEHDDFRLCLRVNNDCQLLEIFHNGNIVWNMVVWLEYFDRVAAEKIIEEALLHSLSRNVWNGGRGMTHLKGQHGTYKNNPKQNNMLYFGGEEILFTPDGKNIGRTMYFGKANIYLVSPPDIEGQTACPARW
ncbi:MAG: hypothetical protein WCF94_00530 [bacterium]